MSRSYKKSPYVKQGSGSKWKKKAKQEASRRVRKSECSNGKAYRKLYNPYDICDWIFEIKKTKKDLSK